MNFLQCNISILFLDSVFMPHLFSRFINLSLWPQNCPLILTDPVILSVHALSVVPELVNSGKCNPIWSAFQTLGIFLAHDVCHIVFSSICCWRIPTYSNFLEQAFSFSFFFFFPLMAFWKHSLCQRSTSEDWFIFFKLHSLLSNFHYAVNCNSFLKG